jgi:hypothetical protein
MNTVTLPQPVAGQMLARGWRMFWRSADRGTRWLVLGLFIFFLVVPLLKHKTPSLYPLVFGIWWLWVPRIALVHREAMCEKTPHLSSTVLMALLIACAPVLAAFLWSGEVPTLVIAVFCMMAGMSAALTSLKRCLAWFYGLLGFSAAFLMIDAWFELGMKPALKPFLLGIPELVLFGPPALVMIVFAIYMWRRFLQKDIPNGENIWLKPLVMTSASGMRNAATNQQLWSDTPFNAWALKDSRATSPQSDVARMRRWIGTPFAPLTRRQQGIRWITFALFASYLLWMLRVDDRQGAGLDFFPLMLVMVAAICVFFIQRLHHFMQNASGELSELAMLPGWGNRDNAKRLLLRAVWRTIRLEYVTLLIMSAMLSGAAWSMGTLPLVQFAGQLLVVLEVIIIIHATMLLVLSGRRMRATPLEILIWIIVIMIPVRTLAVLGEHSVHWSWMLAAWIAVLIGGGVLIRHLLKRFERRRHPFLQQ